MPIFGIIQVDRRVNINIADRVGIRLIKTIETWKVGKGCGSKVGSGNIKWWGVVVQISG